MDSSYAEKGPQVRFVKLNLSLQLSSTSAISYNQPSNCYFLKMISASQSMDSLTSMSMRFFGTVYYQNIPQNSSLIYAYSTNPKIQQIKLY
jgi:hypothetical protein